MAEVYSVKTSDFVNLNITTSCNSFCVEKRFPKDITVSSLKGKLELLTGGSSATMVLRVYDKDDKIVCILSNNDALLGSFQIDDGMRLHVEDKFLLRKQIDEDTGVGKFEMPLEEYAKRTDSLQAYLKGNKLGKYNAEEMEKREAERKKEEEIEEAKITNFKLGDRCEISVPGQPVRRATIMFIGEVKFKPGKWVGIKYDEPLGKNDGMVEGVRYFECSPKYGGFVKPLYVEVGDFPEEEFNLEDEL